MPQGLLNTLEGTREAIVVDTTPALVSYIASKAAAEPAEGSCKG